MNKLIKKRGEKLLGSSEDGENNSGDVEILAWVEAALNLISKKAILTSETIAKTPWSNVLKINTEGEVFYLKKTPKMFSIEPKIIEFFEKRFSAQVPKIIAKNSNLNCFLMKDAGKTLREVLQYDFEEELLFKSVEQFISLQIDSDSYINFLFDMGVPDYRLKQLPNLYVHLIEQKDLLVAEGLLNSEIVKLNELKNIIFSLCKKLSDFPIKQTIVQPDFNHNNILVDSTKQKITIIDLGEIVISHPFFSLFNFLEKTKKYYSLPHEDNLHKNLKDVCFKKYKKCFDKNSDFRDALAIAEIVNVIFNLVYQHRFIRACGRENLIKYGHWNFGYFLREFLKKICGPSAIAMVRD